MKKITRFLLKQYNVGIWLGALQDQYNGVASYVGTINFALIVPTAYHTTLRDPLQQYAPWMTFWLFACFCLLMLLLLWVLRWKIILPSQIAYGNYIRYKHQDLIRRDIARLNEKLERIEKKIGAPALKGNKEGE